jgi:DNA-binding beta-propeller fold protein YncE
VAVAGLKTIYVAEAGRAQIVALDTRGRHQSVFGAPGTLPGEFIRPAGIAVDAAGDLVVADPRNNRVEVFTFGHSAPQSAAPAQQPPAQPPAELVGRLLVPRSVVPARLPISVGCRASRPGFCRLAIRAHAGDRIIARGRIALPVAGAARKAALRLPASFVRHARGRIALRVSALFRDGAGERVTATESLVVSGRSSRKGRARGRRGHPG